MMRNRSIIVDMFQGQIKSRLRCRACGHESVRFDAVMFLSLVSVVLPGHWRHYGWHVLCALGVQPLEHDGEMAGSLDDCLRMFCEEELLSGHEQWCVCVCERGAGRVM